MSIASDTTSLPTPAANRLASQNKYFNDAREQIMNDRRRWLNSMSTAEVRAEYEAEEGQYVKKTTKKSMISTLAAVEWYASATGKTYAALVDEVQTERSILYAITEAGSDYSRARVIKIAEAVADKTDYHHGPVDLLQAGLDMAKANTIEVLWLRVKNFIESPTEVEAVDALLAVVKETLRATLYTARGGILRSSSITHNLVEEATQAARAEWLEDVYQYLPQDAQSLVRGW